MNVMNERQIPLLDLRAQHGTIRDEVVNALMRVVDSQRFILGEDVQKLEEELASYCGAKYAIGCASGSDALSLALMALDIKPGDQVLTVPFTFFATAGAIARLGATPVFVDVDPVTFNMDMSRVEDVIKSNPRVRAIIPVHLFGACVDMDPLLDISLRRGIAVIEDAAQSIGSEYKSRRAGSMGNLGCFSFFPSKNLGGYGDGGMLTTGDQKLAERLKALRAHGRTGKYIHEWIGINSRLDALQAAVLRVKFQHLDNWTAARQKNADLYRKLFSKAHVPVTAPEPATYNTRHVYNQFVVRCQNRDKLQASLKEHGIGTEVYYPLPLHLQSCFADLGYRAGDFPVSEQAAADVLALPVNPEVSAADIEYVCEAIQRFYSRG
jgi:dTDP-4-amino-4,6-dideoxygalactose transaminase